MKHLKLNEVYPYNYVIMHKATGNFYIGYRGGNVTKGTSPLNDLGVSYFGSSSNDVFKTTKTSSESFEFEVISTFDTDDEAREYEVDIIKATISKGSNYDRIISESKLLSGVVGKCKNMSVGGVKCDNGHWRISTGAGKNCPAYGQGHKQAGDKNSMYGKIFSDEHKAKLSSAQKGKIASDETKAKMSAKMKGNTHRLGKSMSESNKVKLLAANAGNAHNLGNAKFKIQLDNLPPMSAPELKMYAKSNLGCGWLAFISKSKLIVMYGDILNNNQLMGTLNNPKNINKWTHIPELP